MTQILTVVAAARADVGRVRIVSPTSIALRHDLHLYLLAEGIGGGPARNAAAPIAIEAMQQFYADVGANSRSDALGPSSSPCSVLSAAVLQADHRVRQYAKSYPEDRGLGAAVTAVHCCSAALCLAQVGHLRGYLFRDGGIRLLTEEYPHTRRYLGQANGDDAAQSLLNANPSAPTAGLRASTPGMVRFEAARLGDVVALVSNGLNSTVSPLRMARFLADARSLEVAARWLVTLAEQNGASGEVSCVLLRWVAAREAPNVAA